MTGWRTSRVSACPRSVTCVPMRWHACWRVDVREHPHGRGNRADEGWGHRCVTCLPGWPRPWGRELHTAARPHPWGRELHTAARPHHWGRELDIAGDTTGR